MENKGKENGVESQERRIFLKGLIAVLNCLIALALSIPGIGYVLTPVLRKDEQAWIKIGRVAELQARTFTKAIFRYISSSGYVRSEKSAFVWIKREANGEITAFSPVCTHMGCNVSWNGMKAQFECPCHGGEYDEQGIVIGGPPPKPLQRFLTMVENDVVYIKRKEA